MSLQDATVEQLVEWQLSIVDELARRIRAPAQPVAPQPPWAMGPAPSQPVQSAYSPPAYARPEPAAKPITSMNAPPMLYSLGKREPGIITPTSRTDPELAQRWQQIPDRADGVPGMQGQGGGGPGVAIEPG